MKKGLKIVDTTLRDGEQCPGVMFSQDEKVELALALDACGVAEIEVGIFDRKTEGREYLTTIMQQKQHADISLWSRLNSSDVMEACKQKPDIVHVGVPVSYVQIYSKLKKNKAWVEKQITECIEVAKDFHVNVTLGFEDSSRADIGFMVRLAYLAEKLGVKTIRLADTVGVFTPERAGRLVREMKSHIAIAIEAHEHNDFGMALANSLEMANMGAEYIDCTLFGIGERAGNCNMYDFLRLAEFHYDMGIEKKNIRKVEKLFLKMLHPDSEIYL